MAPHPGCPFHRKSVRPDWNRNAFADDVDRARSRWARSRPIPFPVRNYPRWSKAVIDRYVSLRLRDAYVSLTAAWMRAYLTDPEVRATLTDLANRGADVASICCLVGFCAEHHRSFSATSAAIRQLLREVLTLKRRPHLARELTWCATELQRLADLGMVGFVGGWLKMRKRLPRGHPRSRSGDYVDFAEVIPRLQRLAEFLGRREIGWANLLDARYLFTGKRGTRPATALDECARQVVDLLQGAGLVGSAVYEHASTLLGPAFYFTSAKAIYMRLRRRAARERTFLELPRQ
jgi:hypothetical protein